MARLFTASEATRLYDEHQKLLDELENAKNASDKYRDDISKAVKSMINKQVMEILKQAPVEDINRDKRGFRVKALRDYGYTTMADLAAASRHHLSSVRGISEDAAYSIKRIVNEIVDQAAKGVKIKLSIDNKTPESTNLISAIYKYNQSLPISEICRKLEFDNKSSIEYALTDAIPCMYGIRWFFTSKSKKQKAEEACLYLKSLSEGAYKKSLSDSLFELDTIKRSANIRAWNDFSTNSIRFINILEEVVPGILGGDDKNYGLPEELAQEIQDQAFFPDGLLCDLRPYQTMGVKYILHQERVLLGDEMGLGKTIQAIASMVSLKNTGASHFVVVCPASVLTNWCREIRDKSKLTVTKIHGTGKPAAVRSWIKTGGVAVTTYEGTGYFKMPEDFTYSMMIVDEAHYIKNSKAKRTINTTTLAGHAQRLLFMTGTALENKVDEMISLIQILQPDIARKVRGMESLATAPIFRDTVAPVYYRRRQEDVLTELPELTEYKEWCTLEGEEETLYEESIINKKAQEARRLSWQVDDLNDSSKARRMKEIIEEAESEGRKIIVFSYFLDTIRKVTDFLGDKCMNPINGSVSPERRQEIIDEFEKAPAGTVLPAQIQAGGTGLNIQAASVVIICEPQFKPSIENQAIARAHRMGQVRNVLVYRLLCENTIDEKLIDRLAEKQRIFDEFADRSVAYEESKNVEIETKAFNEIIQEEIDRINAKNQ